MVEESLQWLGRLFYALYVRQISARLYGKIKILWGVLSPIFECISLRQAIKRIIYLDRIERVCIVLQPLALRQVVGIKHPAPVIVVPAGRAAI